MDNIITILQEIFMGKETNSVRVGLSEFKLDNDAVEKKVVKTKKIKPRELKLSELMRKASY